MCRGNHNHFWLFYHSMCKISGFHGKRHFYLLHKLYKMYHINSKKRIWKVFKNNIMK